LGLSYLFIAHNLAVVEHFADDVAVMYLGQIVEVAAKRVILDSLVNPQALCHPYTQSLISAIPQADPERQSKRTPLPGEVPSPINPPSGCSFHPRCPLTRKLAEDMSEQETETIMSEGRPVRVVGRCVRECPELKSVPDDPTHCHACLLRQ